TLSGITKFLNSSAAAPRVKVRNTNTCIDCCNPHRHVTTFRWKAQLVERRTDFAKCFSTLTWGRFRAYVEIDNLFVMDNVAVLGGVAYQTIDGFEVTGANYNHAVDTLKHRFVFEMKLPPEICGLKQAGQRSAMGNNGVSPKGGMKQTNSYQGKKLNKSAEESLLSTAAALLTEVSQGMNTTKTCDLCKTVGHGTPECPSFAASKRDESTQVLLQTTKANLIVDDQTVPVRALLDSGSQRSYITKKLADRLDLSGPTETFNVSTFGETKPKQRG
ncbi:Y-box factor-like, partial [Paramuricea clavata]